MNRVKVIWRVLQKIYHFVSNGTGVSVDRKLRKISERDGEKNGLHVKNTVCAQSIILYFAGSFAETTTFCGIVRAPHISHQVNDRFPRGFSFGILFDYVNFFQRHFTILRFRPSEKSDIFSPTTKR